VWQVRPDWSGLCLSDQALVIVGDRGLITFRPRKTFGAGQPRVRPFGFGQGLRATPHQTADG
jgi:hypothetical protein